MTQFNGQRLQFETTDFRADAGTRTVSGLLLPYGQVGRNGQGKFRFEPGSVEWSKSAVSRVKLNREHERTALLGAATVIRDTPAGVTTSFRVARGAAGDQALNEAEDAVLDGLSAEVDILDYTTDPADSTVLVVTKARLTGAALTGSPAFDDARVTHVAASAHEGNTTMTVTETAPAAALTAEDVSTAVAEGVAAAFASAEKPALVSPHRDVALVREELPYRFNGERGAHEFSDDVFAVARGGDGAAKQRVEQFLTAHFATVKSDVATLNPTRNRADMYVDQLEYQYPIWSAIDKGAIGDSTPFVVPKYNSSSGLVAAHTEGTEPSVGAFTTTSQTITPAPVSGKVEISRETIDQGGSPQVSGLIWRQMQRAYYESLEAAAVTLLSGLSSTSITLTAGGKDDVLEGDLTGALASLAYIRGGNRFRDFFVQVDLFKALVAAVDGNGRKLFPLIGAQNATGSVGGDFGSLMVGNLAARPAWALAATGTVAANSYLFNREDVHGWATAPKRMDFDYQVKSVFMGMWGYVATACTRTDGTRKVIFDPVA